MHIIDVLRGSKSGKVLKFGHEKLSTYGIGMELSRKQWQQMARRLLHQGLMVQDPEIGGLSLTPRAWDVFRGEEAVFGRLDASEEPQSRPEEGAASRVVDYDPELFETLRQIRKELANAANVPPYVVFSDRTLAEMAAHLPRNAESMLRIHGVGSAKLDRYGSIFLKAVEDYCREHRLVEPPVSPPGRVPEQRGAAREMRELLIGEAFNSGRTVEGLAQQFNIRESRVLDYLLHYIRGGRPLRTEGLQSLITISGPQREQAMKTFEELGPELLRPVFDALGGEIGYDDLRLLRLYYLGLQNPVRSAAEGVSGKQSC
jgi:ATP-dependent DNA helicase RecQ